MLALRVYLFFDGTNRRSLYLQTSSQLFCTLWLGQKPQFIAPCWYQPAGGGVWGQTGDTNSFYNHGAPTQEAILKLARPIIIPVRQNIAVEMTFFPTGTTDVRDILNSAATDDQMVIKYVIDGLVTRDVQ